MYGVTDSDLQQSLNYSKLIFMCANIDWDSTLKATYQKKNVLIRKNKNDQRSNKQIIHIQLRSTLSEGDGTLVS